MNKYIIGIIAGIAGLYFTEAVIGAVVTALSEKQFAASMAQVTAGYTGATSPVSSTADSLRSARIPIAFLSGLAVAHIAKGSIIAAVVAEAAFVAYGISKIH